MTYGDAKETALQLVNQYSNGGVVIPASDGNTLDYTLKFPKYFDACQKEIATTKGRIPAVESISLMTVPSLLAGDFYSPELFLGTDLTDMCGTGALAYTFEADNPGTHYVEEYINGVWTQKAIINVANSGAFQTYHGLITPTNTMDLVRIRHSGTTPYQVQNRALYACTFSSAATVPPWTTLFLHTLPADFWRMNKALDGNQQSVPWLNRGSDQIAFERSITGGVDVYYWKMPATIADDVDDSYEFEIPEEAAQAMPFGVAAMALRLDLSQFDNANILMSQYQQKVGNLLTQPVGGSKGAKNTLFGSRAGKSLLSTLRR